jgi:hypothetical protein
MRSEEHVEDVTGAGVDEVDKVDGVDEVDGVDGVALRSATDSLERVE